MRVFFVTIFTFLERTISLTMKLKIGVLNIMHDKVDTQKRFTHVLKRANPEVEIRYFYPKSHHMKQPIPAGWQASSLDFEQVKKLDGFIITGAPIERIPFEEVDYWQELTQLFDLLKDMRIPQLYVCWGAMAAMKYFYGIEKHELPEKLFGIYPQEILNKTPLLKGLTAGFKAPHARYAEMNVDEVLASPLTVNAVTESGHLTLASQGEQSFLFTHLEYGPSAFQKEYQRELTARGGDDQGLAKPENYFADEDAMALPLFTWRSTQKHFFNNWMTTVKNAKGAQYYVY
ncbi:homoserine O-succinyltransferase [Lactobacillus equicursoris DSM 19284 = JCM 14600 = CIP 110162]|uniref:Serine O-acetyltransferase n=2 Tax=Lactobacillus equicursoris TaxID=420645 RepID=A0A0R1M3B5_9LACO|nr:homoserine O-succinyltransferase [Lactobacillus equicursoris DSM 19284 = JCM 14600 = CIP 110162]